MVGGDTKTEERRATGAERNCVPGKTCAPLFSWPWENLGIFKYILYGPFLTKFIYSIYYGGNDGDDWCVHILVISALRGLVHQLWSSYSNQLYLNRSRRISQRGIDFEQIDREWDWDNFIILQALVGSMACMSFPSSWSLPLWDVKGLFCCAILHVALSEPLFYGVHRLMHSSECCFSNYHWLHHSSHVTHPFTAGHASFMEHLMLCVIVGIPTIGTTVLGLGSTAMIYGYVLVFDFLRCLGHCNVEIFPHHLFRSLPALRLLIYTPTYHSLHHTDMDTNFCLFMPLYDALGKTINRRSWDLHKRISSGAEGRVPDFVFLAHVVDVMQALHVNFVFRSFAALPYTARLFLLPMWPFSLMVLLVMWARSKAFLAGFFHLRGLLLQTWAIPRFGFQYFLPFAKDGINYRIEEAILRADRLGVKVLSLAALNKNEALNGGGTLFVEKHPNLRVRVVHGNTLTAAVILSELPRAVEEVFLAGATSKLGRAIALYLARKRVRVLMLTLSVERFSSIQKEAPSEFQKYLVQVTKYQAAQHCKTWIIGKWTTPREQCWAPPGTHFHQFVVPQIISFRRDCTYGKLAAVRLPDDVEGLGVCEYRLPRGVVHACHAGGVVHLLEGWTHHEVGAIDVDQIDVVWNAALKHGLRPI